MKHIQIKFTINTAFAESYQNDGAGLYNKHGKPLTNISDTAQAIRAYAEECLKMSEFAKAIDALGTFYSQIISKNGAVSLTEIEEAVKNNACHFLGLTPLHFKVTTHKNKTSISFYGCNVAIQIS